MDRVVRRCIYGAALKSFITPMPIFRSQSSLFAAIEYKYKYATRARARATDTAASSARVCKRRDVMYANAKIVPRAKYVPRS